MSPVDSDTLIDYFSPKCLNVLLLCWAVCFPATYKLTWFQRGMKLRKDLRCRGLCRWSDEVVLLCLRRKDVHSVKSHITKSSHDLCCFSTFFLKVCLNYKLWFVACCKLKAHCTISVSNADFKFVLKAAKTDVTYPQHTKYIQHVCTKMFKYIYKSN